MQTIVRIEGIRHRYGDRVALDGIGFEVEAGTCFGVLGPNGGGKTTLFRILSTLLRPSGGTASIGGHDVVSARSAVRRSIGVVFQSPSLDIHLTARENLKHGGHLYGLSGPTLEERIDEGLARMGVADRADDRVKTLSGGLKRRVELAKALLHRPPVLLLDEPSTGLDPAVRRSLWGQLQSLRESAGVTILLTTHFMEEAERCDRLAILDRGRLVVVGTPDELKARVGGDCVTIECEHPDDLSKRIAARFGCEASVVDGSVRIERASAHGMIPELVGAFGDAMGSVTIGRPTLEDVFVRETGHRFGGVDDRNAAADPTRPAGRGA